MKVLITGATGMVGEGVLRVCLADPAVEKVLIVNRKTSGLQHAKLEEILHQDLQNIEPIAGQLNDFDACFFCLGVSSLKVKGEEYVRQTHDLTLGFARTLLKTSPDATFCYVAGAGTDRTEKSLQSWANVKGKTENELARLGFKRFFGLRPGFIKPLGGQKNALPMYTYTNWMFPIGRALSPGSFCTMRELAQAMLKVARDGFGHETVTGKDIIQLSAGYGK